MKLKIKTLETELSKSNLNFVMAKLGSGINVKPMIKKNIVNLVRKQVDIDKPSQVVSPAVSQPKFINQSRNNSSQKSVTARNKSNNF